jgi:hypothetical protein
VALIAQGGSFLGHVLGGRSVLCAHVAVVVFESSFVSCFFS